MPGNRLPLGGAFIDELLEARDHRPRLARLVGPPSSWLR